MRRYVPYLLTGVITLAFVAGSTVRSEAAMVAYICSDAACSLGSDIIVADNAAGDNLSGVNGAIQLTTTNFNGWEIVSNTYESKPALGSAALPQLDISYSVTNIAGTSAGTIFLFVSDTGFTGNVDITEHIGGTSTVGNYQLLAAGFGGTSNTNLDLSNELCGLGGFTGAAYSQSCNGGSVPLVNPYSLTLGLLIRPFNADLPLGGGAVTGDLNLTSRAVTEPATLLMLGTGLIGAAIRRRRAA